MKLFDQTVTYLGADEAAEAAFNPSLVVAAQAALDPSFVAAALGAGLEAMEMAALPPALDQVTICSMDRSRSPVASKVWILGANEGVLPARIQEDSLLGVAERQWLAKRQIHLAPDSRRRMYSEAYLIYIALTRASKSLRISCARADAQGGRLAPSSLYELLCRFFPDLEIQTAEPDAIKRLARPGVSLQLLGMALHQGGAGQGDFGLWRYVYQWFSGRREYSRDMERLKSAYDLKPLGQPLTAALAEKIFGRVIKTSITRAYGLALEPREEYEVQPPEIGNFFHDSLEALMGEVDAQGLFLSALRREELDGLIDAIADRQLEKKDHDIFLTSAWYRSLSDNLRRILRSSARALAWQENQGRFRPQVLEADFGFGRPGSFPPISLDLGGGRQVLLRGRIDRIDRAVHLPTGKPYLRVIDYKSGHTDIALYEIYHGLKLQLTLYMEAALAASPGALPAGMFYYQVHDPVITAANLPEARDEGWLKEKMIKAQALRGYLLREREVAEMMDRDYGKSLFLPVSELKSGDFSKRSKLLDAGGFLLLGNHARLVLKQAGRRLMEGDISLTPYQSGRRTACDYCPYAGVCRFDTAVPGHRYRYLQALPDETVLGRLSKD
jgi:ATP-dependent helicase/nuclease subunit B